MSEEDQASDSLSFSGAMAELEGILKGVEDEEIDIDVLGQELGRAAVLLELCRDKIRRAEVEVTQIVQSLHTDADPSDSDPVSAAAGDETEEAPVDAESSDELPF